MHLMRSFSRCSLSILCFLLCSVLADLQLTLAAPATQPVDQPIDVSAGAALPTDPADVCGQFDNGLHYIIRRNTNPPGKVFLNLAVRTGSLNETAEQNGLAHFLEHMAFKGSAHFAPMRLIPTLTHLGMRFGADTNAHTNKYETVFKLSMPDTKPETTQLAMTIFSDFANGLSLYPIQIESERRVILEEMRSRISLAKREMKQQNDELFPGSRMSVHDVLGDPRIIKQAQEPLFRDYWNRWYRPESMTLVVAGDIDPPAIIAQAKPLLGMFTARAPAQSPPDAGLKPFDSTKAVVISDPERVGAEIEMINLKPVKAAMTTVGQLRQGIIATMAEAIMNRRFSDQVVEGKAEFQAARVGSGDVLRNAYAVSATAETEPQDWRKALRALIHGINQAADYGFSEHELKIMTQSTLASAAQEVSSESSQNSGDLVTALTTARDTDKPVLSGSEQYQLLKALLPGISASEVKAELINQFKTGNYAYVLKLPEQDGQPLPTREEILAEASTDWQEPTVAMAVVGDAVQLLPTEPLPGAISSRQVDSDLGITTVVFDNGVVLHHRFSDYKKDQVLIRITLPGGAIEETSANHGISAAASLILARPATSQLSSLQIRDLFTGKNVSVEGGIGLDSLSINVGGSPADIPLGLQLVSAVLSDAKLEQPALDEWKKSSLQALGGKATAARAQLADTIAATVMGGDVRFAALTEADIKAQQRNAVEAWFKHIAGHSAMEVSVVGAISSDDAIALIGKYLGSLAKRTGSFEDLEPLRRLVRPAGPYAQTISYSSTQPKALVMAGFIGCDEADAQRRPLTLAASILTERMVQHIRFEQQIVYSISCNSTPGRGIPGMGILSASAPTDPKNADRLADSIVAIIREFAAGGPTDDELQTARKQMANRLASEMQEPSFWLGQTAEMQYRHRTLADLKQLPGIYASYSASDLRDAVRKYATDDRLVRMVVLPQPGAVAADKPSTQPTAVLK
jgi:zinc protease